MADTPQDHLLDWLRDAHAMEEQAITMLEAQASRLENYPALRRRVQEHLTNARTGGTGARAAASSATAAATSGSRTWAASSWRPCRAWADRWPRTR